MLTLSGRNKRGQSLDEVRALLLGQLELLKKGEFPDWLMEAAINNLRLQEMRRAENYRSRAMAMSMSFLNDVPYENTIDYVDRLAKISKDDIVAFANKHLREDNYVVVYKRQGQAASVEQVQKPAITPIHINRDVESPLLTQVKNTEVTPIQPVFLNYKKDLSTARTKSKLNVYYAKNEANPTFSLTYRWEKGAYHDLMLPFAGGFVNFLGTNKYSAEEIGNEFYKLACTFNVSVGNEETRIVVSGLSENMDAALALLEELILNAQADDNALQRYIENVKKSRQDSKANQQSNLSALVSYAMYGPENPSRYTLTDEALDALTSQKLIESLQNLWQVEHQVIFFGPQTVREVTAMIDKHHRVPKKRISVPSGTRFEPLDTKENKVYFAHYDANQSYLQTITKGLPFNLSMVPQITMYNGYFGGGMNAIVFQEMREKRGLAYTARSNYSAPGQPDQHYMNTSFIATQNDKVVDAFSAFNELFDEMPLSETSFRLAQEQLVSNIRTQRIRNADVIWNYLNAQRMGYKDDIRKTLYSDLQKFTLNDVSAFNQKYVKGQPKTYVILGHEDHVDFDEVEKLFGPVTKLTKEDLFIF